ncbi:DNA replication complex GINS family protein [Candidatus Bathyarchaeota archaeon]|nr:DNA replication complex GINS family protein [Candidatus Bathyarchaeota archaeon]
MAEKKIASSIEDADYLFENKPSRVIALRSSPKIELAGFTVGPFEEGNEYEVRRWVAERLEEEGIVRLREDEELSSSTLYPILHRERIQPLSSLSSLPEDFYPRLRRILESLKKASRLSPDKMREYEYVENLSKDIVSCRLKKIVSLASTLSQRSQLVRNLTPEETALYNELTRIINEWRSRIL